jgi:hypothetical protein
VRNAYSLTNAHSYSYFNPAAYAYAKKQSNTKGSPNAASETLIPVRCTAARCGNLPGIIEELEYV